VVDLPLVVDVLEAVAADPNSPIVSQLGQLHLVLRASAADGSAASPAVVLSFENSEFEFADVAGVHLWVRPLRSLSYFYGVYPQLIAPAIWACEPEFLLFELGSLVLQVEHEVTLVVTEFHESVFAVHRENLVREDPLPEGFLRFKETHFITENRDVNLR